MEAVLINTSALLLVATLTGAPQQGTAPAADAEPSAGDPGEITLPVDLEKIQEAVSRPPAIRTDTPSRPVFRVEVFANKPTIEDILGADYLRGPSPYGGMTHQEFLNMVTPADYRGFSAFTNREGLMVAATSVALQWAVMKAVDKLKAAHTERAKEAARREVLDAMNELEKARARAGLSGK